MESIEVPVSSLPGAVLAKAARRADLWLGLTDMELTTVLQVERLEDLYLGSPYLNRAVSLIQLVFRLECLVGASEYAQQWVRGHNTGLGRAPIKLLMEPRGLVNLVDYVHRFAK